MIVGQVNSTPVKIQKHTMFFEERIELTSVMKYENVAIAQETCFPLSNVIKLNLIF